MAVLLNSCRIPLNRRGRGLSQTDEVQWGMLPFCCQAAKGVSFGCNIFLGCPFAPNIPDSPNNAAAATDDAAGLSTPANDDGDSPGYHLFLHS